MKCFVVLKNQWQAQPVAQPPVAAGVEALVAESALALVLAEAVSLAAAAVPATAAGADVPPEPPLKSVAYQPEPLSWKPAAVSCLENVGLPHSGQSVSGASAIFCSTSLA
jgi:hypothetical protein